MKPKQSRYPKIQPPQAPEKSGERPVQSLIPGVEEHSVQRPIPGVEEHPVQSPIPGVGEHPAQSSVQRKDERLAQSPIPKPEKSSIQQATPKNVQSTGANAAPSSVEMPAQKPSSWSPKLAAMRNSLDDTIAAQKADKAKHKRQLRWLNYRWYRRWLWVVTMQEVRLRIWLATLCYFWQGVRRAWREWRDRIRWQMGKLLGLRDVAGVGGWPRRSLADDWRFIALFLAMWGSWFIWLRYLWLVLR